MPTGDICQKWNIYRCLYFRTNNDVYSEKNSDVITIKLNICQKWNICQEWDICDMPKMEYSLGRWCLFSENGDAITGQKGVKKRSKMDKKGSKNG